MSDEKKTTMKERIFGELRTYLITVLYIWVLLSVFDLHREIVLAQNDIHSPEKVGFALINALVLAKFMWLGEVLHAGKRAARKALLHFTIENAAIFAVILTVCHVVEELLVKLWHGQAISGAFSQMNLREMLATAILVFVVLLPFFLMKGLLGILGAAEVKRLLLSAEARGAAAGEGS